MECPTCNGKGEITIGFCESCDGNGEMDCPMCEGKGDLTCYCKHDEEIEHECWKYDGSGKIACSEDRLSARFQYE